MSVIRSSRHDLTMVGSLPSVLSITSFRIGPVGSDMSTIHRRMATMPSIGISFPPAASSFAHTLHNLPAAAGVIAPHFLSQPVTLFGPRPFVLRRGS